MREHNGYSFSVEEVHAAGFFVLELKGEAVELLPPPALNPWNGSVGKWLAGGRVRLTTFRGSSKFVA